MIKILGHLQINSNKSNLSLLSFSGAVENATHWIHAHRNCRSGGGEFFFSSNPFKQIQPKWKKSLIKSFLFTWMRIKSSFHIFSWKDVSANWDENLWKLVWLKLLATVQRLPSFSISMLINDAMDLMDFLNRALECTHHWTTSELRWPPFCSSRQARNGIGQNHLLSIGIVVYP